MLKKRFNVPHTILFLFAGCGITLLINEYLHQKISKRAEKSISIIESDSEQELYKFNRIKGYKLIKPLTYVIKTKESKKYIRLRNKVLNYIESQKSHKKLISASVFIKDFEQGDWVSINDTETYYPGSLIKVPGMITFLKMAENKPDLFNKKYSAEFTTAKIPIQTFGSQQIESGKQYNLKELLKYMISYSDNNATYILNKNVDLEAFHQLFKDLDIPPLNKSNARLTAKNYSMFLNVLFNGSYLNRENSEYAVELLAACDFKIGMVKGLPVNTIVAHKFGEMGDENTRQLHESGIIYVKNSPYLLTIMTKGYDIDELPSILGNISKMVYNDFAKKENHK